MAKTNKADMSCARVKQYTAFDVSKAERHNERKNETYENMNVITERIALNVHFKKPTVPTYMEQLKQMETDGLVSLRGLRKDATLFNEIVIDVNTMYFERNGGYEYAKQFYEEAYHFIEEKFGADNVISAVMHADEINVAATEELGKEVYHYHLHAMVLPVVEKEILWSKRCKDPELRGTVKEVVNQISHSKKWKSDIPMTDEKGNPLLKKNGKPMFRASYSILQDELFNYMTERGFKGFQRGEYGSTAEHLTSLQKLKLLRSNHMSQRYALEDKLIHSFPMQIASTRQMIDGLRSDMVLLKENTHPNEDGFSPMMIDGRTFTEKKAAGTALLDACNTMTGTGPVPLGSYRGFQMTLCFDSFEKLFKISLQGALTYKVGLGPDVFGNIQRMENLLESMPTRQIESKEKLKNLEIQVENAKQEVAKPFPRESELKEKSARLDQLNILLNMDKRENEIVDGIQDEGEIQPQRESRDWER